MSSEYSYFSRRADEERAAAVQAGDPRARRSHLELAERYSDLASAIAAHEGAPSVRLSSVA